MLYNATLKKLGGRIHPLFKEFIFDTLSGKPGSSEY
jgi:hypothetical protein